MRLEISCYNNIHHQVTFNMRIDSIRNSLFLRKGDRDSHPFGGLVIRRSSTIGHAKQQLHQCGEHKLDLSNYLVADDGMIELVGKDEQLEFKTTELDISWNHLTDKCCEAVIQLISRCPNLTTLRAANNQFSSNGITIICKGILKMLMQGVGKLNSVYLGAEHLTNTTVIELETMLHGRWQRSRVAADRELYCELHTAYKAHTDWEIEMHEERITLADRETRSRQDIETAHVNGLRLFIKRRNEWMQEERSRLQSEEIIMNQTKQYERRDTEDDEGCEREQIERMFETERKHLLFAEENSRRKLSVLVQHRQKQKQLVLLLNEFREKVARTEQKQRSDLSLRFKKGKVQTSGKERRSIGNSERHRRDQISKSQEDTRKQLLKQYRTGKSGIQKELAPKNKRTDIPYLEVRGRSEIISEEQHERRNTIEEAKNCRKRAREMTFTVDKKPLGILRVLERKEAYCRLDIQDQQEAERHQCNIGYLMDIPGLHGQEHISAMEKLKQQQAEEFSARARNRSLMQMDDLSVLHFDAYNINNLQFSEGISSFVNIPR